MTDRTAAGRDLLAAQIVEIPDGGLLGDENGEAFLRLPHGGNRLDRHVGRRGKGEGRIADQAGFDRTGAERLQQRRRGRKLLPLDPVGNVFQHAGGFHDRLRIALLVAHPQGGLSEGRPGQSTGQAQQQSGEQQTLHSAATPLAT